MTYYVNVYPMGIGFIFIKHRSRRDAEEARDHVHCLYMLVVRMK
jgi:hypothetical protein